MNTKIAMSAMSILTSLALVGGATFAAFTDQASSTGNTFGTGSLNLQLDDTNEVTPVETVTASIAGTGMVPGGTAVNGFISAHNGGTTPIAKVLFGANQTAGAGGAFNIADKLNLTVKTDPTDSTCASGADQTGAIATQLGDGFSPLTMSELVAADYDALSGLAASSTYYVCLTAVLDSSADNNYQNLNGTFDFVFTGSQ